MIQMLEYNGENVILIFDLLKRIHMNNFIIYIILNIHFICLQLIILMIKDKIIIIF